MTKELKKSAEAPGQQSINNFLQQIGGNSSDGDDSTIPSGTENVQRNEQQPPSIAAQAVVEETRSQNDPGMLVLFWSGFEVFLSHLLLLQMLLFRIIIASKKRRWWTSLMFQRRSMMVL